ncbi:hypothetical protein FDC49_01860 [Clostridium sporogenes]|uniref:hypothetical protein n=1 Tax=Clostridium TaxID=1485 RepID=UPI000957B57B|nr:MULTISPECIES: hypothetical protein [Clostridium]APU60750.1 hypothetical protein NPD8_2709 [Clostridium botulinum]NFG98649.1 hypothetical protein [Clostridium sporogenes]NFH30959.1 hypothetical protein [Clostridium sporogenes]NFL18540.1 hypothetical protein [Clostridium sporogenes]NFN73399.1 hypothetical protein [Clostridium sporogenes]
MDWKEELVLQFRELTIDKNIISSAMVNFVKTFNKNLDKYRIDNIEATTDRGNFIYIKDYKKIKVKYVNNNEVYFTICDKNETEQDVYIKLSIIEELGCYLIDYINTDKKDPQIKAFIDESTIDEILKNLFELNQEVRTIRR